MAGQSEMKPVGERGRSFHAGREQLKAARRRYGLFLWNSLARLKSIKERNRLLLLAGQRAIECGLYSAKGSPWMASSGLLNHAVKSMAWRVGKSPQKFWYEWVAASGFDRYGFGFSELKIHKPEEDAA